MTDVAVGAIDWPSTLADPCMEAGYAAVVAVTTFGYATREKRLPLRQALYLR